MEEKDLQAVTAKMQEVAAELEKKHAAVFDGSASKAQAEAFKSDVLAEVKKQEEILKAQGLEITNLKNQLSGHAVAEKGNAIEVLEKAKQTLLNIKSSGSGHKEFLLGLAKDGNVSLIEKAADVHSIGLDNPGVASSALTGNTLAQLNNGAEISTLRRDRPWILDFVFVGSTNLAAYPWFDETPKEGSFVITDEGEIKPLVEYHFTLKVASYKKIAGRAKLTEEFAMDFPGLVSKIKELMQIDCKIDMNNELLTDLIAAASPYVNASLVGQITDADDYAAIAAAIGQLGNFYYEPNILVLNNNRAIAMGLEKATGDGQYLISPLQGNNLIPSIGKVITHPSVTYDQFFIGDGNVLNVLMRGDTIVKIGYSTGDWEANMFSVIVEQYYYSFVKTSKQAGLVKGSFSAIKASIEGGES